MRKPAASVVAPPAPGSPDDSSPGDVLVCTFNTLRDELVSTLWFLLGNPDDAQDAAQEAFLRCWRAQDDLPRIQNLRAWIFRVALNVAKDVQRSAWRRRARPLLGTEIMPIVDNNSPPQQLEDQEWLNRLRQALLELRPEEKEVFLLRQNGDLTYEQIAEQRKRPVGTVKTQMRSALQKLRRILT
jgi:RNA polymerase sigma-70 factor (ECF subfamily)